MRLLDGIRVLELGSTFATAFCGRILADAGAEVVKVEPPTGDPLRRMHPVVDRPGGPRSAVFEALNLGKRSTTLDDDQVADGAVSRIVAGADVLLDGRQSARDRSEMRRANSDLVHARLTPYGDTGPKADHVATELIEFQASGLGYLTPRGGHGPSTSVREPLWIGTPVTEAYVGVHAAAAIAAGLVGRRRLGRGIDIELSVQEVMLPMLRREISMFEFEGGVARRGTQAWRVAPTGIKACRDGYVLISVIEDREWQRFASLIGHDEWATDERFATAESRFQHGAREIDEAVTAWVEPRTKVEVFEEAQNAGVPLAAVNDAGDLYRSSHLAARGFWHDGEIGFRLPGSPLKSNVAEIGPSSDVAPSLGEANEAIWEGTGSSHWPGLGSWSHA